MYYITVGQGNTFLYIILIGKNPVTNYKTAFNLTAICVAVV